MKTLYVSDMDGTLLGADSRVSGVSRRLINDAVGRGALFTVATARTPGTVAPLTAGLDMRLPAVVMTGSALWHPSTGAFSDVCLIAPEDVAAVRSAYSEARVGKFIYTFRDNHLYVYYEGEMTPEEELFMKERSGTPYKMFMTGADGKPVPAPEDPGDVVLMFGIQPTPRAAAVYETISRLSGINPMMYHDFGPQIAEIEAFAADASKAKAVMRLKRQTGADRLVVFGDNRNDLSMLRVADVAVAMENAVEEVKEMADVVIGPNTEDSVARFITDDFSAN